jgi:hypothetical protein
VGKPLCKFNGVAVMRKIRGIGDGANRSAGGLGSIVVCERKLEARSLMDGQGKRTRPVGVGRHRASEIGVGVSCRDPGEPGRRAKLELGRGKSLDDHHGSAHLGQRQRGRGSLAADACFSTCGCGIVPSS